MVDLDPSRGGPDFAAYESFREATAYRWAVICRTCYSILHNYLGLAEIGGRVFTMAGASRGDRARTINEARYRAFLRRQAAKLAIDLKTISDEVGAHSLFSSPCEKALRGCERAVALLTDNPWDEVGAAALETMCIPSPRPREKFKRPVMGCRPAAPPPRSSGRRPFNESRGESMAQKPELLDAKATRQTRRPAQKPGLAAIREDAGPAAASIAASRRRAPKLRRAFPPLEAEREACLRDRNRAAFADDPRRVELERRLLDLGGTLALLFLPDPQIGELLERGCYFPGAGALMCRGEPSGCHANAAMMFVKSRGEVRMACGYALSDDGLWRQHSWGIDSEDGRILETTDRRVRYYGYVMNDRESAMRLLTLMGSGHFWPDEVEEAREFLESIYGPMPAKLLEPSR